MHLSLWLLNYSSNGPKNLNFSRISCWEKEKAVRGGSCLLKRDFTVLTDCHITVQGSLELRTGQVVTGVGPHLGQDCRACQHFAPILTETSCEAPKDGLPGACHWSSLFLSPKSPQEINLIFFLFTIVFLFGLLRMGI